jgi:hypothetical protein
MFTPFELCFHVQVRAQNLQELVYKQGSAGITKATVSIVFHNNDPANGPSGYEDKEYITVTRQVRLQAAACACWCFETLHNSHETRQPSRWRKAHHQCSMMSQRRPAGLTIACSVWQH